MSFSSSANVLRLFIAIDVFSTVDDIAVSGPSVDADMSQDFGLKRKLNDAAASETVPKLARTNAELHHGQSGAYIEVDDKSCFHRIAWPKGQAPPEDPSVPTYSGPLAKDYPFELDPFQRTSIACLEQGMAHGLHPDRHLVLCAGDSVLVSAHTSAGKTVVAQYACAMALRDKTRMIYTSPLKALSNQKYRELYDDFQDVGLLTGDVTIREDASCLVVTTEVFRSMLYENQSIIHEVKAVVFDEVHYLRDKERGVVWEECLILMPPQTQAVFLSATVPNGFEFASWFATVHGSKCHVVYTEHRPVPLQHYIFPAGADGMYMTIDEKGRFFEENFQQACADITGESITSQVKKTKDNKFGLDETSDIFKLMKMVLQRGYDPVIVFAFSKRTCELLALQLAVMDINDDEEKQLVDQIVKNAMDSLSDQDRRLPQVQHILPMLKRGIGVHHSGLLPIVKEIVELLFQEGFIKILFATETFSTGLNMPAKTVVFAGAKKFDDGRFRWLFAGEYIQMSGRAGRRGIDDKGVVIMIADKGMDATIIRDIIRGTPLPLLSEFRISYRLILDNLKMESGDPEIVIRKSFKQFLCQAAAPQVRKQLETCEQEIEALQVDATDQKIAQYVEDCEEKERLWATVRQKMTQAKHCLPFLNPGRLLSIAKPGINMQLNAQDILKGNQMCWGSLVNFKKKETSTDERGEEGPAFVVDVLINSRRTDDGYEWLPVDDTAGAPHVIGVSLDQIHSLSTIRIHLPANLKSASGRLSAHKCQKEVIRRLKAEHSKIPLLDAVRDMKINSGKLKKTMKKLKSLEEGLGHHDIKGIPDLELRLEKHFHKLKLMSEKRGLEKELEASEDMILKQELRHALRLLIRLQFIDDTGLVLQKGRIALHFRTADELILTEMIFNGQLATLMPEHLAALVSCVIQPEANMSKKQISAEMTGVFQALEKTAIEIGKSAVECKAAKHAQEYVQRFRPSFMEAVYAWSKGASFGEVIKLADIYEGSAVRMIRQVHRVLVELEDAVKLTGQQELQEKIHTAQDLIKRDVIFAASLYL